MMDKLSNYKDKHPRNVFKRHLEIKDSFLGLNSVHKMRQPFRVSR